MSGTPDDKAQLDWMRKQFAKLGIDLNVRATLYNVFQDKMRKGNAQIFSWGWYADYPDPENFFFLLYGPNGKVAHGGENAANYDNPAFNALFNSMKNRPDDAERQKEIDEMLEIVRKDVPWVWGVNTESLILRQNWTAPVKPSVVAQNSLQYIAIDVKQRNQMRQELNKPLIWPLALFFLFFAAILILLYFAYRKKNQNIAPRFKP